MRQPNTKPQWDFGRFLKTLSYFGAIPLLSSIDWFQAWIGGHPTTDGLQIDQPRVLVIAQSAMGQAVAQRLLGKGFNVRLCLEAQGSDATATATEPSAQPAVERAHIQWDQPLQPDVWRNIDVVVCLTPTSDQIERLLEVAAIAPDAAETLLVDFTHPSTDLQTTWGALDDVVMGGVSSSSLSLIPGAALFAGTVSTANSGGFASVRSRNISPPLDLSSYQGLALRLQGDGQRYKFLARSEDRWDGVAYSASFDTTANEWMTIRLPFEDLIPVFRARTVSDGVPINQARICSLQFMLSKFEYDGKLNPSFAPGPFQLKLAAIAAYRAATPPTVLWVGSEQSQLMAAQQVLAAAGLTSYWVTPAQQSAELSGDRAIIAQLCAEVMASPF